MSHDSVVINLSTKRMVSATLDGEALSAKQAAILIWFDTIFAFHVKIHAYGPGSSLFHGVMENTQIGERIATLMGFDLNATTQTLATPLIAVEDTRGRNAQYATWD